MSSCRSSILSNSMSSCCSGVFCVWVSIGVLESRNTRKEGPKKTQNYQLLKWVRRPDAIQPHDGRVAEERGGDHLIDSRDKIGRPVMAVRRMISGIVHAQAKAKGRATNHPAPWRRCRCAKAPNNAPVSAW